MSRLHLLVVLLFTVFANFQFGKPPYLSSLDYNPKLWDGDNILLLTTPFLIVITKLYIYSVINPLTKII